MKGKAVKKPVEINYFIWDSNPISLFNWCGDMGEKPVDVFSLHESDGILKVKTLEGSSYEVPNGYIIIRGIKGEYYPCEPKIFQETYKTL